MTHTFFCTALAEYARQQGVEFRFRTEVVSLEIRSARVTAAITRQERLAALSPVRVHNLLSLVRQVLPQARLDPATARPWCGLRAISADGVPLIGWTPVPNLLVNTGHGHLGWTMPAESAQSITNLLSNEAPSLDPAPYNPQRFALTRYWMRLLSPCNHGGLLLKSWRTAPLYEDLHEHNVDACRSRMSFTSYNCTE